MICLFCRGLLVYLPLLLFLPLMFAFFGLLFGLFRSFCLHLIPWALVLLAICTLHRVYHIEEWICLD